MHLDQSAEDCHMFPQDKFVPVKSADHNFWYGLMTDSEGDIIFL